MGYAELCWETTIDGVRYRLLWGDHGVNYLETLEVFPDGRLRGRGRRMPLPQTPDCLGQLITDFVANTTSRADIIINWEAGTVWVEQPEGYELLFKGGDGEKLLEDVKKNCPVGTEPEDYLSWKALCW